MEYYRKINGLFGTTSKKDYLQKQAVKSINNAHSLVLSTFEILIGSDIAEDIVIDDFTNAKCIFDYSKTSQDTKAELASYIKEMWIEVGKVNIGSIVNHTDKVSLIENTYIVVSKQEDSKGYDVCYIQKSNNTLQFYDSTSTLHSIPCIISKGSISLDEQKIISTLDSEIAVQISNTSITRQIEINDVYKIGLRNYTIVNIDDITVNGLLLIKMQYSEVSQETHTFVLTILNGSNLSIQEDNTLQLNVNVTDNGVLLVNPTISYVSSNNLICSVNSSGLVTSIGIGSCTISASANGVSEDISVIVVASITDDYSVAITGSESIKINKTSTYVATVYNNGVIVGGIDCIWSLVGSYASINSQDGDNCVITAGKTSGNSVALRATKSDDITIYKDFVINIVGLW